MLKNQPFIYLFLIFILILSCSENPTSSKNTEPTASVTVDVTSGTTTTIFNFDASSSSDNEDSTSALQFRWDWENDGTWDTDYSAAETATHQYSTEGDKVVKLEVKDSGGLINSTTVQVLIVNYSYETGTVSDIDGNVYQTVKIGNQWWMAENLKVIRYRNGEAIPNVTDETEWKDLSTGAYCSYANSETAVDTFGLLYNWHAVSDLRTLAPEGWHIPSFEEWET